MDVFECIHKRRAIKKFLKKPVEKEKLGIILDAARMAPSSGNLQNWRFIIIKDMSLKSQVASACYDQLWLQEAPMLIVVVAELDKVRRFYGIRGETLFAIQNCAVAAQNMMLAATGLGLGSNFVSAFDDEVMSTIFSLPGNAKAQAVIPIGYPDEDPVVPIRYPLETLVYFNAWKRRFEELEHVLREHGEYHRKFIEKTMNKVKETHGKVEKESKGLIEQIKKKIKDIQDKP
ncbi:nitroreductase [Candidatus Woesearchaeota archaeon CG11_big_fil_rev_8_21_14_0_20_43_8]|nr:MAG: nitroreductase [Candidatus Woesearchaeota archaeon CG11_big_fil_rev_8_21_14_0_20_43_8]PIO04863.1 MAG: nitroreductase [Candidatus Woesearchaeota archaeon CG08_land_8_20_14_0_20_43_7]